MDTKDLQPLFDYFDEHFGEFKQDIKETKARLTNIETALSNLAGQIKIYHDEMTINSHRIDRLEKWAKEVSEKFGIPLPL
ncbi:MAG TPA: hypothetical protein VEA59_01200 [Patescibacteria group bacterium]|nr:hypothetical protein [Patescibacteria group bacterium]